MEILKMNFGKSYDFFQNYKDILKPNGCYSNIYSLVRENYEDFEEEEVKVGYGYWGIPSQCFIRHCFLVEPNGEVVDPSVFFTINKNSLKRNLAKFQYLPITKINVNDYDFLIEENDFYDDLREVLREEERTFYNFASLNHYPIEIKNYEKYLKEFDKDEKIWIVDLLGVAEQ